MGEISIWGNVHIFGESPPLKEYGVVLNLGRTRREVCITCFEDVSTILTLDTGLFCRYVWWQERIKGLELVLL